MVAGYGCTFVVRDYLAHGTHIGVQKSPMTYEFTVPTLGVESPKT